MTEIKPELVKRMVAMTRKMAAIRDREPGAYRSCSMAHDEARAIVAELPEQVDRDLLIAEEVAAELGGYSADVVAKHRGKIMAVEIALAAIKRVRSEQGAYLG